jgi:RNA polymerase sigma-70 factor (ECF subfamily)
VTRDEFAALALSYMEELAAFAHRLTANVADADDLVQTTYERAFRAWPSLRDRGACRSWLFRIARNAFRNDQRALAMRRTLQLVDLDERHDAPVVPADVVEQLDARALEQALSNLPSDQREAVLLCDLWGFTYAEVAEITRVPVGTVRSRIARGRARVMTAIAGAIATRGRLGSGR